MYPGVSTDDEDEDNDGIMVELVRFSFAPEKLLNFRLRLVL
jgi:hypothetical protein